MVVAAKGVLNLVDDVTHDELSPEYQRSEYSSVKESYFVVIALWVMFSWWLLYGNVRCDEAEKKRHRGKGRILYTL